MAEGGKWSRSFKDSYSKGSGDADESFCDPCKSVDDYVAVEGYCPICDEYLCGTCLEVHKKQKMTRAHVILDKKEMPCRQGSVDSQDLCVNVCKSHYPEIIRFYCKAHDEPGCGDCMTLKHTACKKDRVQDISGGFQKTDEFTDIDKKLQQVHQELEEMEGKLDNNLKNLDTTYNNVLHKIISTRKQINEYLDKIQTKITNDAALMKQDDETELKTLQAENQAMKAEIEAMLKILHHSGDNVNSLFVTSKQAKHRLVTMKQEINHIKQSQQAKHRLVTMEQEINHIKQSQQQQYDFLISNEIEKIVSTNTPLGKLTRRSSQKSREMTKKRDPRASRTPTINSTATYNRHINLKQKTDKKNCYIMGCSLLSDDRMVVTDWSNNKVNLIDLRNNTVISHSSLNGLCSVTAFSTNSIAVTLPDEGKIQVLNVTTTLTLQREIKVKKNCYGIAYKDGKFAVSYLFPGRVEILDIQGKILDRIQPKQGKYTALQEPEDITFGHDNDTVIVSDRGTKVVSIITFSGQILHTYIHESLNPRGIVITADGVMFVCSYDGCVHAVSPDFKTSKIIINHDNHVVRPQCIAYCEINHRLYISISGCKENEIQVYDLKELNA